MLEGSDSVSPVSSLLKNSSVVHVASFGEHVLVIFRRNVEDSFRFWIAHHPYSTTVHTLDY